MQITTCSGGWSGDPACKAARPVPASGSMMVMVVHGWPPSEVTKHDGCDSHVKHRERGVPNQSNARLSVSLRSLIHGGGPVRQHEIKLSSSCRLYITVRLERDKQCLGGRVHACGWNSGLCGFPAQRSVKTSQEYFFEWAVTCCFWMELYKAMLHRYLFTENSFYPKLFIYFSKISFNL